MNDTTKLQKIVVDIDSKYRNLELYPNANYFVFEFDSTIKDVVSVELAYMLFFNNGLSTRYLQVSIPEFDSNLISNIDNHSFAHIPLFNYVPGYVEHTRSKFTIVNTCEPRIKKLSKITIDIRDENGNPVQIERDFMLRFEITCFKWGFPEHQSM